MAQNDGTRGFLDFLRPRPVSAASARPRPLTGNAFSQFGYGATLAQREAQRRAQFAQSGPGMAPSLTAGNPYAAPPAAGGYAPGGGPGAGTATPMPVGSPPLTAPIAGLGQTGEPSPYQYQYNDRPRTGGSGFWGTGEIATAPNGALYRVDDYKGVPNIIPNMPNWATDPNLQDAWGGVSQYSGNVGDWIAANMQGGPNKNVGSGMTSDMRELQDAFGTLNIDNMAFLQGLQGGNSYEEWAANNGINPNLLGNQGVQIVYQNWLKNVGPSGSGTSLSNGKGPAPANPGGLIADLYGPGRNNSGGGGGGGGGKNNNSGGGKNNNSGGGKNNNSGGGGKNNNSGGGGKNNNSGGGGGGGGGGKNNNSGGGGKNNNNNNRKR